MIVHILKDKNLVEGDIHSLNLLVNIDLALVLVSSNLSSLERM